MADAEGAVELTSTEFQEGIATAVAKAVSPLLNEFIEWKKTAAADAATIEEAEQRAQALRERLEATENRLSDVEKSVAEGQKLRPEIGVGGYFDEWPISPRRLRRAPRDEQEKQAQLLNDSLLIVWHYAKDRSKAVQALLDEMDVPEGAAVRKALDTYTSAGGAEWIPTIMSTQFIEAVDYRTVVKPLIPVMGMTAKNVTLPGGDGDADVYRLTGAENTAPTESTKPGSRNVQFNAEDLAARRSYSDNLEQDAVISAVDYLRGRLARGIARQLDLAILDGDTSGTHMDSDVTLATDPRKMWIGLRRKARTDAGANVDLGTFNLDGLLSMPANMQEYADYPEDLVWLFASKTYWGKLITLKDAADNPAFLPAYAPGVQTPIVTGQIGWLAGIPVVYSGLVRTNLNATGVYDGTTTTKTVAYLVNRQAWLLGERREITFESGKDIETGTFKLVARWRGDLQHMMGTGRSTAMAYNI